MILADFEQATTVSLLKLPHACKNKMTNDHVVYCLTFTTWSLSHFYVNF